MNRVDHAIGFRCCAAAVALLLQAQVVHAQVVDDQLLPAPQAHTFTLTAEPGRYSSPVIAINGIQPQQLVVAFQPMARAAYSIDGAAHWAIEQGTGAPAPYRSFVDTSVAYDRNGYAIMCFTALDGVGPFKYWGHNPKRNAVLVRRSPDGGKTWEPRSIPVIEHADGPGIPFEDLPAITADVQPHSPHVGNLYVAWTQDRMEDSLILLARSVDGGLTWSKPVRVSEKAGGPRDDNGIVAGVRGVVAPDGALHLVWSDAGHVVHSVSHDGGKTFSRNQSIVDAGPFHFQALNVSEANGYPQIGMMAQDNDGRPRLYVTWSDFRNGDVDIFCISSTDGGRSWSAAVRVNNDSLHNAADQLFPSLAVDSTTGAVNVMFYDRRRDPSNRSADVVLARSTDGGRTFVNYLLSEQPFDPRGGALGEYTTVTALGGRVYGSWTEIVRPSGTATPDANTRPAAIVRMGVADFGK